MTAEVATAGKLNHFEIVSRSPWKGVPGSERSLAHMLSISTGSWVGKVDGEIICVWGLVPPTVLSDRAWLWLLTTDAVEDHKFIFTRYSQRVLEVMLRRYPTIIGETEVDNHKAIRWLRWLGASFQEHSGGRLRFIIRKK